jgi:hypothetical protein
MTTPRRQIESGSVIVTAAETTAERVHRQACQAGLTHYEDPETGFLVMTELAHRRRGYCCGNACRHCPYGHVNVPPKR